MIFFTIAHNTGRADENTQKYTSLIIIFETIIQLRKLILSFYDMKTRYQKKVLDVLVRWFV